MEKRPGKYKKYMLLATVFCTTAILVACSKATASTTSPSDNTGGINQTALIQKGQALYQNSANGSGCQICHGIDGKGKANFAPAIRGEDAEDIKEALKLQPMNSINLTNDEINGLAAYLGYLETQP